MTKGKIYLREGDHYVGPFHRRKDAELFLILIETCGESSEGIEIVELGVQPAASAIRVTSQATETFSFDAAQA